MAMLFKRVLIGSDADDGGDEMAAKFAAECDPYTRRIERLRSEGAKDWAEIAKSRMNDVTPEGWEGKPLFN